MNYEYEFERQKLKEYLGNGLYTMLTRYNTIVAGGAITSIFTNKEINDIDIYFRSKKDLSDFLYEEMRSNWVIAATDKAILFKYENVKIQAVYFKYFDKAEDIFDTFDFTVCMGAYDFSTESFVLHRDFLKHNSSRILKFNQNTAYPVVSALRVDKYKHKGYYISKVEFLRIMLTILDSNIDNYETLKSQLGGMYGENYDNILKPEDNEDFDLQIIISKMADLNLENKCFLLPNDKTIEDWDEFVYTCTGEKIKYFEYNNNKYRVVNGEIQNLYKMKNDNMYEETTPEHVIKFPLIRYKYVKRTSDGRYFSYYDTGFEWKAGKNIAKFNGCYGGIYAVKPSELNRCSYSHEKDRALLELKIESMEDIHNITTLLDDVSTFKSVEVLREVPLDEVEVLIKSDIPVYGITF